MSSILDALRKSERVRRLGRAPVYRDAAQPAQTALLRGLSLAAGVLLLAALVGSVWLLNRPEPAVVVSLPEKPASVMSRPEVRPAPAGESQRKGTEPEATQSGTEEASPQVSPPPVARDVTPAVAGRSPGNAEAAPWLHALPDAFRAGLPALIVNIHVYAPDERQRILYINNRPLKRGEEIDGVVVEEIVPEGVVLRARGQRFRLPRPS